MLKFTGLEYLYIDIANSYGLDKKPWEERINFVKAHLNELEALVTKADSPAEYMAGVLALRKTMQGQKTGYLISLDATSSGPQLLACLLGDTKTGELCNLVNTGNRANLYQLVYDDMLKKSKNIKAKYADVKKSIMTAFYGSEAKPKEVFGEKNLEIFEETMSRLAPAVWLLNKIFLALWDPEALSYSWVLPDNFNVNIKVIDKVGEDFSIGDAWYTMYHKENIPMDKGRSLGANITHSIDGFVNREMCAMCMYDKNKVEEIKELLRTNCTKSKYFNYELTKNQTLMNLVKNYNECGYLSARVIDYIDEYNIHLVPKDVLIELLNNLPEKPFSIITIHDCYKCHPNYGNDVRLTYRYILICLAKSTLLNWILSTAFKRELTMGKVDNNMVSYLMNEEYAIC